MTDPVTRILARVEVGEDHWLWPGSVTADGYPTIKVGQEVKLVYRVLYEALVGPIPDGHELDHLCNVRRCVRPEHLEPVTHAENCRRAWARRRDQPATTGA